MKIRTLLAAALFSSTAMAGTPPLPAENEVIPLVLDEIAVYAPALNRLLAMQIQGCITLDITPISYTWSQVDGAECE